MNLKVKAQLPFICTVWSIENFSTLSDSDKSEIAKVFDILILWGAIHHVQVMKGDLYRDLDNFLESKISRVSSLQRMIDDEVFGKVL